MNIILPPHIQQIEIPFDALTTLIVFLIGIPALVFQSMTPDVRRIFFARKGLLIMLFGFFFPILCALVVSGAGIYTEINSVKYQLSHESRWVIVLTTMIVQTIIVAIYFPLRFGRRQGILSLLEHDALNGLNINGRLGERSMEDIIDLGKNAESAQEKSMVLQTIHKLITKACNHASYTGDNLETPILKLHEVIILDSQLANLENFRMTAEILQEVAVARKEVQHVADLQRTVKTASSLGRAVMVTFNFGLEVDNVILSFVQTLSLINYVKHLDVIQKYHASVMTDVSEALFEIGSLAIKRNRSFVGVAALDKMTVMLCQAPNAFDELPSHILDELSADVLGLMAHLWIEGQVQKEFIQGRLSDVWECIDLPVSKTFNKARLHYLEKCEFETANRLAQMAAELKPKPRRKK